METIIDIRICYEIEGNEKSLGIADGLYEKFQEMFKETFPKAKLKAVYISKSDVKKDC